MKKSLNQMRRALISAAVLATCLGAQSAYAENYDVFLLVGQSNMSGRGIGADEAEYSTTDARIAQWNEEKKLIEAAPAPIGPIGANGVPTFPEQLSQQDYVGKMVRVGLGRSFAKSYAMRIPADRKVLLVGAAFGGTGFNSAAVNNWTIPNGTLPKGAVARINAAMAAAGEGAVFKGIIWHQGEADSGPGGAEAYGTNMRRLMNYFKANIVGANASTPWIVGEVAPQWLTSVDPTRTGSAGRLQKVNHTTPDREPFTAWVSTDGLMSNNSSNDIVHMNALAQRELGRRYSDKFFEAANNMPQPHIQLKSDGTSFYNIGRTVDDQKVVTVKGTLGISKDPAHGNVANVYRSAGSLEVTVAADFMSGSYTKSAWVKLASYGRGHMISGQTKGQDHYLYFPGGDKFVGAGHSNGLVLNVYVKSPVAVPLNTWTMTTVTYDAPLRLMKLYQDGVLVAQNNNVAPAPAVPGTSLIQFGAFGSNVGFGVDGNMADQRVYKSALSAAQITALYDFENSQRAGF